MMLWVVLTLTLRPAAESGAATTAELRARAEAHAEADRFVEAGEAYLQLARRPDVRPRDALFEAHSNFDSAFIASGDASQLCRALWIAERVVAEGRFDDDEQGKFWAEIVQDDLGRLAKDAATKKSANCRFDAAGRRAQRVALLGDDDPPRQEPRHAIEQALTERDGVGPRMSRRYRVHTATGAVFTGIGVGLLGVFAGALVVRVDQVRAIHKQAQVVEAQGRHPTPEEEAWVALRETNARSMQPLMLGAALAGGASLVTGVVLVATRQPRRLTVRPFAGLREAGLLLRGRF